MMKHLNRKIRDLVGLSAVHGRVFGVEIEIEGVNLVSTSSAGLNFKTEADNSLRGGVEYVSLVPKGVNDICKDIEDLDKYMNKNKMVITDSPRAGVHIHINFQDYTALQLYTFLTLYYVLENAIVRNCGKGRVGNLFCLRLEDAMYIKTFFMNSVKNDEFGRLFTRNVYRYAAMNTDPLFSYGTLEFRALRTPTDITRINPWVKMLDKLVDSSLAYENPAKVIEDVSIRGYEDFAKKNLGEYADTLQKQYINEDLRSGVWNIQSFAYCNSWSKK